ncbi:PhoD-like phosphatase [Planctomycetes bacterium CA13]|uniref:PhoD-like phosphatase n=1 Tax=Novipirellula herctigrandis TaxID=2527986 RepID=A0A5C5Z8T5_9BACT|nr:PhoD-like phosphatase [Planctomycetes bacterium CA13]
MKTLIAQLCISLCLASSVIAQGEPEPVTIPRKAPSLTIPDVARDQVICFAMYTVHDEVLKLSAHLYPLKDEEAQEVSLETKTDGDWKEVAKAKVDEHFLAVFRVEGWDASQNYAYRVTHPGGAIYEGTIRRDPIDKNEIVVAAFTGNSNKDRGPRTDIVSNVSAQDPDLLFFSGDQSYDHSRHYAAWLLFGRQFGEIIKDRPTICIPDDHDVGQGNLWGESGKKSYLNGGADGGYIKPAEYVNEVQRAQCSNLPDPFDPTPIEQGIGVYYTDLNVGGIDFAIIEDRKFKTGPAGLIPQQGPRPDHVNDPSYDRDSIDAPEAKLLGERQLEFLQQWAADWNGVEMKSVLSQTIFGGGAHLSGSHTQRLLADMDSNGWPQTGRQKALMEMRRGFAVHIAGDQHLATVIHHGVNSWEDAGYSFCVPSIVNYYARWWAPLEAPGEHDPNSPLPYTGRSYDGFGNKLTMKAYANPSPKNNNGAGHGIIRFNKSDRKITFECWPRNIDVTGPQAEQYPGWPITISQFDNYSRQPMATLPSLQFVGEESPVVKVTDQRTGELVYAVRAQGNEYKPIVFHDSVYTIEVIGKESSKVLTDLEARVIVPLLHDNGKIAKHENNTPRSIRVEF